MGVYVYVPRKRPTDVRLDDGTVVQAYPLTYVSKLVDFNWFFDRYCEWYGDYKSDRMQVARSQRTFEDVEVEYVYVSYFDKNPIPLAGNEIYKISSLVTADVLAYDMDYESACSGGPAIFWADCDSLGELQGALLPPLRVGRKWLPWTLTAATEETRQVLAANERVESARRRAKREARRCV
jgi:hypothetical protein